MKSPPLRPDWVAPRRTALLLIDMQRDFAAPDGAMGRMGTDMTAPMAAVAEAGRLAAAARAAGVPLAFTRFLTVPGRETATEREAKARRGRDDEPVLCLEGSAGAAFIGPQPRDGELVVTKYRFSAFPRTGLAETLAARGIDTLVLAGLTTECCVQSSAWDAFERDFHVVIAADACAAYDEDLHRAALKSLELSGALLAPVGDLLRAWE